MAIKSGIGIGEAQVFDNSSIINNFARLVDKTQKEQAEYEQGLADVISKVNVNGARDIDKPIISKYYDEIKSLYGSAATAKNDSQRRLQKAMVAEKVKELNNYTEMSKKFASDLKATSERIASNMWDYDTDVVDRLKELQNKSILDLGGRAVIDPFEFQPSIKPEIREKGFDDIYKTEENRITGKDYVEEKGPGDTRIFVGVGSKNRVINDITAKLGADQKYRQLAFSQYMKANPGAGMPDIEDVIANEVKMYEMDKGYKYAGKPTQKPEAKSGDGEPTAADYEVGPKKFYSPSSVDGVPTKPRVTADFERFVTVKSSAFSPPQLENVYNIAKGKNEPMKANKDMKLTGLGYYVNARNGVRALRATVVDSDNREYMMQPKDLPVSIRKEKSYSRALKALGTVSNTEPSAPAETPKPTTVQDNKAQGGYKLGQVVGNYKYNGGDPASQSSWSPIKK